MPVFIVVSKHTPENCPIRNESTRKIFVEFPDKLAELLQKYAIKLIGNWAIMPEHKIILVLDAPTADVFQKLMVEPYIIQFLSYNETKIKWATPTQEGMKLLK